MSTWTLPPHPILLEEGEVHVWRFLLDPGPAPADAGRLPPDELARAARFMHEAERNRFLRSRLHLRRTLARYVGEPAESIAITRACRFCGSLEHGKPRLAAARPEADLRFNLSHSGDLLLIALARGREVGVDVERDREGIEEQEISRMLFSPGERAALAAAPEGARRDVFFRLWARKEAYLKARGYGLVVPPGEPAPEEVDVSAEPFAPFVLLRPSGGASQPFACFGIDLGSGWSGSLVVEGAGVVVRWFDGAR